MPTKKDLFFSPEIYLLEMPMFLFADYGFHYGYNVQFHYSDFLLYRNYYLRRLIVTGAAQFPNAGTI